MISGYLWTGFFVLWVLWAFRTKPTERRESVRSRLSYSVLLFVGLYLIFARYVPNHLLNWQILPNKAWMTNFGVALTALGLLFAVWARASLGTNWSGTVTLKSGHELVRSGPYRWVRHPIYSGLLLATIGTTIERGQIRAIFGFALILAGISLKIRREEEFMNLAFGSKYDEYKRTTGGLIPRPPV